MVGRPLADWLDELFSIKLASYPSFKNKLNSYIRNKTIESFSENHTNTLDSRSKVYIASDQKVCIHNVVILDAFFGDVKVVKRIFEAQEARERAASILSLLYSGSTKELSINLSKEAIEKLENALRSNCCLKAHLLPNPFEGNCLPQTLYPDISSLNAICFAQASANLHIGSALNAFIEGDYEHAYKTLPEDKVPTQATTQLDKVKLLIANRYQELVEFEQTLEMFQ